MNDLVLPDQDSAGADHREKPAGRRWRPVWIEVVALLCITAIAAAFRLPGLETLPPGLHFDEAHNGLDAFRITEGARPVFLLTNDGREVLYSYLQAVFVAWLGPTVQALRLASAWIGVVTVPATYVFVRYLTSRRLLALVTASLLAVSLWHVALSRIGVRSVLIPLGVMAVIGALWAVAQRPESRARAVLLGTAIGLGAYVHPANWFAPLVVVAFLAYCALTRRGTARVQLVNLVVSGSVAVLVFLPMGSFVTRYREAVAEHPRQVSVLGADREEDTALGALARNAGLVAGATVVRGDTSAAANLPGRPVFTPLVAAWLLVGVAWLVTAVVRPRSEETRDVGVLLAIWLLVMALPSVVSNDAPHFKRLPGLIPAVYMLPAAGLVLAYDILARRKLRSLGAVLIGAVVVASAVLTVRDYFGRYPAHPDLARTFWTDATEKGLALRALTDAAPVYVAPILLDQSVIAFHVLGTEPRSFEMREGLVRPDGGSAAYVLDPVEADVVSAFRDRWGETMTGREVVAEDGGADGLAVFELLHASQLAPDTTVGATFGGGIELAGYDVDVAEGDGEPMTLTLHWRRVGPIDGDYTVFVHVTDRVGEPLGQHDKVPLGGSYQTSEWQEGEWVLDRYVPDVNTAVRLDEVVVRVGLYDPITGERLEAVDRRGERVAGDAVELW